MSLLDLLNHRRAVRDFDPQQKLDTATVQRCLEQSVLAPTSSNMQLWEAYHVTNPTVLQDLSVACLNQGAATTAQEMVVFVTRPDRARRHAALNLEMNRDNIRRHSPQDRQAARIRLVEQYYARLMPIAYARFFGLIGLFRSLLAQVLGLFRPVMRQVSEGDIRVSIHKSCALVIQSFMLSMAEAGYDTCPLEGLDSLRVKKALGLPRYGCEVSMIIACGVRTPKGVWGDRLRLPIDTFYHRV